VEIAGILIFFMEEAPNELKSIVEFLNSQMERTEVLVVEAKQYLKTALKLSFRGCLDIQRKPEGSRSQSR